MTTAETLQQARALGLNVYAPRPASDAQDTEAELCAMERDAKQDKAAKFHARNDRAALQFQVRYDAMMMVLQRSTL